MMKQLDQNDDLEVQYNFTAYIVKAFRNYKADYYNHLQKVNSFEILFGDPLEDFEFSCSTQYEPECDWTDIKDYIENEKLLTALTKLSVSESLIIFMRMVRQMSPIEAAGCLGKSMSAVNKMYYRAISKLRLEMDCPPSGGGGNK